MNLADRIEKRLFVGREFLLWLWFETELFEATLSTAEHGSFGMWIEKQFVMSETKNEVTRIKGSQPGTGREAKEALLRGKLPEVAGLHLTIRDQDASFVLKAESMAVGSLRLPTVLGGEEEEAPSELIEPKRPGRSRMKPKLDEGDVKREAFEERMKLTREFEELLEALYRDFLALRLSPSWRSVVVPAMKIWAAGEDDVDVKAYRRARTRALAK